MADDVLLNKAAVIERSVARAREEYAANPATFAPATTGGQTGRTDKKIELLEEDFPPF